jgi:beta-lactamase superfamily II metal-dependent hydrolase
MFLHQNLIRIHPPKNKKYRSSAFKYLLEQSKSNLTYYPVFFKNMKIIPAFLILLGFSISAFAQEVGQPLPAWKEGFMDLHHINTGRGDAAFFVLPDGTTMLVDAGEATEDDLRTLSERNTPRYPNTSKLAYEWIVDYIQQFGPSSKESVINYALITHFHSDHFGQTNSYGPVSKKGGYQLTGLVGVGDQLTIQKMLDRDYPDYKSSAVNFGKKEDLQKFVASGNSTANSYVNSILNYWEFLEFQKAENGMEVEKFTAGKLNQLHLKNPENYPTFSIRNIQGNGWSWTGVDEEVFDLKSNNENDLSLGFKISYGDFDYFTGGDIRGVGSYGEADFNSVESNIAPVIGPVDVATLNHHGNRDSQNHFYVRTLRPRVWVQQSWSSDHPGDDVLRRITSTNLYPGKRDLFTTSMLEANKLVIGDRIDQVYGSTQGHILIRVDSGGNSYRVFILNDLDAERKIKAIFGPYQSR